MMADAEAQKLNALLSQDINAETAKIAWSELQRFFAAGRAIHVSMNLDLVEAALQIANDNSARIGQWMDSGEIATVSDAQARDWIDTDAIVWAVVVKPWVLVQEQKENHH